MKKYIFLLILILNIFNLFAYDKQAYKALLSGGKKFENVDLSNTKIKNIDLSDVVFVNVNLSGSCFKNSMLTKVKFDSCNLSGSKFYDVVFDNALFLNKSTLKYCIFERIIFDTSEINGAIMANTKILNSCFTSSKIYNVNMDSSELESVNFSACTLENIDLRAAKLELVKIYETTQLCSGISFDQAHLSRCSFLGQAQRSSVIGSNFYGATIANSYFVNLNFDNCKNLDKISDAPRSLFDNIFSINAADLDTFAKSLKNHGAKFNREWLKDKDYWDQFEAHHAKAFFAQLFPKLLGLTVATGISCVCPAVSPFAYGVALRM